MCYGAPYRRPVRLLSGQLALHGDRCASGGRAGDAMPQNGVNFVGRRRARHNTCKANDVVSSQVPSMGLVNGPVVYKYCSAAASRTCQSTPAGTLCDSKPPRTVNGYINHGYRGNITTAVPPKTLRKQGGMISAISDASAPGRLSRTSDPGSITVSGATKQDSVDLPHNFNQVVPDPSLPASGKNQRRRRYYRHKKRHSEVACLGNSASPLMPPQKEDWENEIQEVTLTEWEQKCFGVKPYGPEDVLHFALRDLTLKQRDTMDLPVTASYRPVVHHPSPVKWFCYSIPTEPDQFADADE
ncbi:uncharacterized protein LOC111574079 [Amphiprion ocellaris]|uniref:uncharacterized protein LOC111574079 n=1 Tax=Amphiprion ocellaris TaxID=80972 RepID=UPI0024112234|nr:uncharacterized protein LOC111574079 [Amphiprion ocellaris]